MADIYYPGFVRVFSAVRQVMAGLAIVAASSALASTAFTEGPHSGSVIRYGHQQEPACLYAGWIQAGYIPRQYADKLVARTQDGRIVPALATSWMISSHH